MLKPNNRLITVFVFLLFLYSFFLLVNHGSAQEKTTVKSQEVSTWTTSTDRKFQFDKKNVPFTDNTETDMEICLLPSEQYQTMDGFGAAITGSTCYNLLKMTPKDRKKLLVETFHPQTGMGYSYIRISIGCSDFSLSEFTCCDTQGIENFAIHQEDREYLIPILQEILSINPKIKIMASPWTCPCWMKVNNLTDLQPFNSWTSGQLNPKYYQDYATYFVKYIQSMKKFGIDITSITIQNEPLNRGNSASLFMTWQEQKEFIKTALGPQFQKAGLKTEIIIFDHNYNYDVNKKECRNQVGYPLHIYNDAKASQYITGAAYHAYGGDKKEMERIHKVRPDKGLYFTEMSIGTWNYSYPGDLMWCMREVCLGTVNYGSKAVIVWNFLLDDKHGPYRPGGCNKCMGVIDINKKDYKTMVKNSHYFTIGHLSKVVMPNARRIGLSEISQQGVYASAFINPNDSRAIVVLNDTNMPIKFTVREDKSSSFVLTLPAKAITSALWHGNKENL